MLALKQLICNDVPLLQLLLEKSSEYLQFQEGEPVSTTAAEELFLVRPENISSENKLLLGIFKENYTEIIGVFEIVTCYPDKNTLCIGLMLIEPSFRGKGYGMKAYYQFEEWAINRNFSRIRLGVLDGNEQGLKFWERVGYINTGERKAYKSKTFTAFEKKIIG